ncbi:efflux RND transporter periplasmic adaptor subunit [Turneriella parva]|uniref:Sugar-specific permease EIIA 1 domain-containing protein n=1 Tax=Turneriella parva (strain ATCC BAA-1111 / DSM 21527 / NCTC 11395 / H) TaxID=869212 RepID=I4BBI5_TURPD|nr:efflux RND transporter periplasmic adaptor subunit [Turneriella parva]AFM14642.1 sugar-specific permease EIIA 1 domain-containing protein [Turneriella parva DSM 21527]
MDIVRVFFQGKRKYFTIAFMVAVGLFALQRIRSAPPTVELPLKKTTIVRTVYGLGTVQAEREYQLKIGIAANIRRLYVHEGDAVKAGDKLVEFDQVPTMRSPISGVVSTVSFEEGEAVFPQNPVLKVIDLTRRYITVSLDEKAAVLVKKAQKVRIAFEGIPGKYFAGSVVSIYPSEGQFFVKVDSKELPAEILPGMSADLAIEAGTKDNVFVAPIRAVQDRKVTIIRAGKKLRVPVQLGLTQGEHVEIVAAELAEGDILRYQ